VKSRGLRTKLFSIAIAAGICITAALFALQYFAYRSTRATSGEESERSLLTVEAKRFAQATSQRSGARQKRC
jgi:hypothetical protein